MNKYKEIEDQDASVKEKKRGLKSLLSGQFLNRDQAVKGLPFILFMSLLGIFYIANGYQAEKLIRHIYKTNNELKELRSEYITNKSDLMYISKQSQLATTTEELGLKELTSPPKKIELTEDEMEDYRNE